MIRERPINVGEYGTVSALLQRPRGASCGYVLAHGAGAGMQHRFMSEIAHRLEERKIATYRFQFPYMEAGSRRPDHPKKLHATIAAAVADASKAWRGLPLIGGGKSMGGRMTSQYLSLGEDDTLRGVAFLGFPLHAPGRDGVERADHLKNVKVPMLFVQGTRDKLAEIGLITSVSNELGRRATLHVVEDGDHSFAVPKRTGRSSGEIMHEIADALATWVDRQGFAG